MARPCRRISMQRLKVEGIGEDFLPSTLDLSVIDEVVKSGIRNRSSGRDGWCGGGHLLRWLIRHSHCRSHEIRATPAT
jgi:hypothetical protein